MQVALVCLFQILVRTVPIKEGHKLRFAWPITPEIHHYKEAPCRYLGHLIGHEGEGSLYYILKTLGEFCSICYRIKIQGFWQLVFVFQKLFKGNDVFPIFIDTPY